MSGYNWTRDEFPELLVQKFFAERTQQESAIIVEYLLRHIDEFDRVQLSVRIGAGAAPNAAHLEGINRSAAYSYRKRIDVLAWTGERATIIDAKQRLQPSVLGQLLGYRQLFLEEHPNAPEPRLVGIARFADDDTKRILEAHGIDVYLYPEKDTGGSAASSGVLPVGEGAAGG